MMWREAVSCWRAVVVCRGSRAAFAESCRILSLLLFTIRAVHFRMKRLIAVGFSQVCTVSYQPQEEGTGCKGEEIVSVWLLTIGKGFYCHCSGSWFLASCLS